VDLKLLLVLGTVALSVVAIGGLVSSLVQAVVWKRASLAGIRVAGFCLGIGAVDAAVLIVLAVYPTASWVSFLIAVPVFAIGVLFVVIASRLETQG
jgi:hypothetical protein